MPRYIANDQRITIGQAKSPEKYEDNAEIMGTRNAGLKNLYNRVDRFGMFDETDMTDIEDIEQHIKDIKMMMPEGTRVVICIDSFNDVTVRDQNFRNDDERIAYVAKTLKSWSTTYDAIVMCTAHIRKTNGKRPTEDDLKDTIVLRYEATMVILMYNEVGIKEESAVVYWESEETENKMPVAEVRFAKNKHSSMKRTRFFEFIPDYSLFMESSKEDENRYASHIHQG